MPKTEKTLLSKIHSPQDLKKLTPQQLPQVCDEIRQYIIDTLSLTGGHLASNLGTVELTVALHYVYNSPNDKICWDVGHQTYAHKILTGRKERLSTVRQFNGISGFPKREESQHDLYNVGHAGTSISQALGEAIARDRLQGIAQRPRLKKKRSLRKGKAIETAQVVAVIGDASISSGMAFEALNHAGHENTPFLIVLNDNEMSISPSVGALNYSLNKIRHLKNYRQLRLSFVAFLKKIPVMGPLIKALLWAIRTALKVTLQGHILFEELGIEYLGPIDAHDVKKLVHTFQKLKNLQAPTILHIISKKGKGFDPAEYDPVRYHGVKSFFKENGQMHGEASVKIDFSKVAGNVAKVLANSDPKVCAITPAMKEGSGLVEFADSHPDKFFDVGIAEQHAVTLAGALSRAGLKPFCFIYSTFLQRGYDQLIHDVCLMNLPVNFVIDRAGCVGNDGETHQGFYDFAFMSCLPHIKIFSARHIDDIIEILHYQYKELKSPTAIRFAKDSQMVAELDHYIQEKIYSYKKKTYKFLPIEVVHSGDDALILCEGKMAQNSLAAAQILSGTKDGLTKKQKANKKKKITVVALKQLHPLPLKELTPLLKKHRNIICIENSAQTGGFGQKFIAENFALLKNKHCQAWGFPSVSVEHGNIDQIEEKYGLSAQKIAERLEKLI